MPHDGRIEQTEGKETDMGDGRDSCTTIFMCGDVMTGRGIDQILPHPGDPRIHEPFAVDAREYVRLAEAVNGRIPAPVDDAYIWGDALAMLDGMSPDVRIINLETAVTRSDDFWKGKGINYRMHPDNAACLTVARVDVCSLANNHVLDWGYPGLAETLQVLKEAGIRRVGAGMDLAEAAAPAVVETAGQGRVVVFGLGTENSGIPREWAASHQSPGVNLIPDLTVLTARGIESRIRVVKRRSDIVVCSIHWGGNWGYRITGEERDFAHGLIDAGADIIHGHSSHHVRGIEVYRGRPIIYGCGDLINDYEGIGGYESFRGDLSLMYFADMDHISGELVALRMKGTRMRNFRLNRASSAEILWLRGTLNREGKELATRVEVADDGTMMLQWG